MLPVRMLVAQPKATAVKLGTTTKKHYRDSICAVFPSILSDTANTDLEWSPRDVQHLVLRQSCATYSNLLSGESFDKRYPWGHFAIASTTYALPGYDTVATH